MSRGQVETYYLLDVWADAPPSEGMAFIVRQLRARNDQTPPDQVRHRIWLGLVERQLLHPTRKSSPREWKQAKRLYRKQFRHHIT